MTYKKHLSDRLAITEYYQALHTIIEINNMKNGGGLNLESYIDKLDRKRALVKEYEKKGLL